MTRRLSITFVAILVLAGAAACRGSDVAVPDTITATNVAITPATTTLTPTEEPGGTNNVLPEAVLSEPDAPVEILPGVELGSLCSEFSLGSELPGDLNTYNDMITARGDWAVENYIRWSPDGSQILFDVSESRSKGPVDLYAVAADGSRLEKIVDASSREPLWGTGGSMMSFDVSPDGSRIAYSACTYNRKPAEDSREDDWVYNYEIVLSDIDGTNTKRLTENTHFDNFPTVSPDGTRVAFISDSRFVNYVGGSSGEWLVIYTVSTGESKEIALPERFLALLYPLKWSPDGESIAFVGADYGRPQKEWKRAVYTVGTDGSGLTAITEAASAPAWSPDGRRFAVAVPRARDKASLYTFAADGSRPRLISPSLPRPWGFPELTWMGDLAWSPDGSRLLLKDHGYGIPLNGSPPTYYGPPRIPFGEDLQFSSILDTSWSPDGSQIATRNLRSFQWEDKPGIVYVQDRDGTNIRSLVEAVEPFKENIIKLTNEEQ